MAQHLKYWYRDHRDRDRPACEAMEPLSDKLAGQSKSSQRAKLGYVIAPSLMDRLETSKIAGAMMHDSLTAASRAVHGTRGEAINVTLTSGHGMRTQSKDDIKSMERAWARQNHAVVKQNKDILKSAHAVDAKKPWSSSASRVAQALTADYEPDDDKFPDLRNTLDRDDAACAELNAVYARNNTPNLQGLVRDYTSLLAAGCGANQAAYLESEADHGDAVLLNSTFPQLSNTRRRNSVPFPATNGPLKQLAERRDPELEKFQAEIDSNLKKRLRKLRKAQQQQT